MRQRRRVVQEGGLGELAKAERAYAAAAEKLHREILFAHEAGSSLRAIAIEVKLSPESVRTIVHTQREARARDLERIERGVIGLSLETLARSGATRRALAAKWGLSVQDLDG